MCVCQRILFVCMCAAERKELYQGCPHFHLLTWTVSCRLPIQLQESFPPILAHGCPTVWMGSCDHKSGSWSPWFCFVHVSLKCTFVQSSSWVHRTHKTQVTWKFTYRGCKYWDQNVCVCKCRYKCFAGMMYLHPKLINYWISLLFNQCIVILSLWRDWLVLTSSRH